MTRHVLISGASIAGPALAHQVTARGWRATVVERAPQLRDEGHNVDVRGAAREVLRRMRLDDAVRAASTRELGMRLVDADGRPVAAFPVDSSGTTDGPTAELEILRGELGRVLHEATRDDVEYRFDTQISDIDDRADGVTVTLDDGERIDADVVVIAEGLRSRTRDRFFGPGEVRELGMYGAYLTVLTLPQDDRWWNWCHATGHRAIHLRPDNTGTSRAMLTFLSDVRGLQDLDRAAQVMLLRRTFADVGWVGPRILAELDDAPMYFDAIGQVRAQRWSSGRVALLGDAAYCPSPLGGGGTSLALIGAYVLAGELAGADDPRTALRRYEDCLRPAVISAQDIRIPLQATNPRTASGIRRLHRVSRVVSSRPARLLGGLLERQITPAVNALRLPEYPVPASSTRG